MSTPEPRTTAALAGPLRPPRRRRLRRLAVIVLLLVPALGLLTWLLRRPLFENWIRTVAATELSALLGAEVEVGAITGNWLTSIRVDGVALRGREGDLLRDVQDLTVSASLSPWQLLRGEPAGLRNVRVHARRVALETTGRPPGGAADADPSPAPAQPVDLVQIARLLPHGAEVHVDELVFGAGDQRRTGTFRLVLAPGEGVRRVHLQHGAFAADVSLHPGGTPAIAARIRAGDPGQLAACLGKAPLPVNGGTAVMAADVTLAPLRIAAHCALDGLRGARSSLPHSAVAVVLDERRLEVQFADLDLGGLRLAVSGLGMPSPLGGGPLALAGLSGGLELHIADLEPWRALLPDEVAAWMPVTGRIQAWIDRGVLHVGECKLMASGASFAVDDGRLALADAAAWPHGDLALRFAIDVPAEREVAIAGVAARGAGRVAGTVAGSFAAPRVEATLALGPVGWDRWAAARIGAAISLQGGVLHVGDLVVEGVTAAGAEGSARLDGSCDLTLPGTDRPLAIAVAVRGEGHPGLLTAFGLDPAIGARGLPLTFAVAGEIVLPADAPPTGHARIDVADVDVVAGLPATSLHAEVRLDASTLHVDRCSLAGPAVLELHGAVPLADGGALDLVLEAKDQDVRIWTSLLLPETLGGSVSLRVAAQGTFAAPVADVEVDCRLESLGVLAVHWPQTLGAPPPGPWQVKLRARHGEPGITVEEFTVAGADGAPTALRLDGSGVIPWHFGGAGAELRAAQEPFVLTIAAHHRGPPEPELPWHLAATLAVAAERTELRSLELAAGPGSVRGTGSVALGFAHALAPPATFGAAAVAASAQLADLPLETLRQFSDLAGQGSLQGDLTLAGTLAQPEPVVRVHVAGAQLRVPGAPRITDLSGRIEADLRSVTVTGLRAKMGASPVTFEATLKSSDPQWADPAAIEVRAHLQGEQALVVSTPTVKVRGDVDLTATGTLAALQVGGTVAVTTGRFAQRLSGLPGIDTLRGRGGAGTGEGVVLRLLEPALGQRIDLDIALTTRRDFEVRTHVLDTDLRLDLRLRGDASAARLNGTVSASSGMLRLPGSRMVLRSLLVTFLEEQPFHPDLQLLAEGRRHGYRIQATVRGTTRSPEIVVSSTPALPSEDLLVLVTTGSLPQRLQEQGGRGQATVVGAYLAEELAAWYLGGESTEVADETFFDRFTVESGREVSDEGLETVLVEFKLSELFSLQGERDVYEDINGGICIRWRFR